MTPKKDPVEGQENEGRNEAKEDREKEEEMKRGNDSNRQDVNNENEEKNGQGGGGSNMKLQPIEDDDDNEDKVIEEEEEEEEQQQQELSGDEDDLENTGGIPYELNKPAVITLERLLKKNEDDLKMEDEELVSRSHKQEETVEAPEKGYPYSFTQWVEGAYQLLLETNERRREDPKEESPGEVEIVRKMVRKRGPRKEDFIQRGANEGNKDVMPEESKKGEIHGEEQIKVGKRKRTDETENEGKKTKTERLPRKEREAATQGKDQERRTQKLKQGDIEGKSPQRGVEEEETEVQGKKSKLPQLRVRKGDERMTTQHLQEVIEEEEEEEEREDNEQELESKAVQQKGRETPPEAAPLPQQAAVSGGGHLDVVKKKKSQQLRSVIQQATAAKAQSPRGGVGVPRAAGRAGRRSPLPPSPTSVLRQVFVKGLPPGTTPQELRTAMEIFGAVAGVSQPHSSSFAFVSFKEKDGKQAAVLARTVRLPHGTASIRPYICHHCRRAPWTPRGRASRAVRWW